MCQDIFNNLKILIYTAPVLALYDSKKEYLIKINISNYISAEVFL